MRLPWFYLSPVRVVKAGDQVYDPRTKTLSICLETPFETAMVEDLNRAKAAIATYYHAKEPTNAQITAESVTLQRIPLTGYELAVLYGGSEIPIESRPAGGVPVEFVNKPTFTSPPVTDSVIQQQQPIHRPNDVQVRFRGYY